jgi:hypothetical protein
LGHSKQHHQTQQEPAERKEKRRAKLVREHASQRDRERIRKKLARLVDEDETPRFCYTTLQALKNSTPDDDEVWQMVGKPLEVFGLKDI